MTTLTPTITITLGSEQVLAILRNHGVRAYATPEGVVMAHEEATLFCPVTGDVRDASAWIVAPTTVHELSAWLGY